MLLVALRDSPLLNSPIHQPPWVLTMNSFKKLLSLSSMASVDIKIYAMLNTRNKEDEKVNSKITPYPHG